MKPEPPLSPEQDRQYRMEARRFHRPGDPIFAHLHPVIKDECRKIDEEAGKEPFEEGVQQQ